MADGKAAAVRLNVVPLTPRDPTPVVAMLEDVLARAKKGEVHGLVLVLRLVDREQGEAWTADVAQNVFWWLGAVESLKFSLWWRFFQKGEAAAE